MAGTLKDPNVALWAMITVYTPLWRKYLGTCGDDEMIGCVERMGWVERVYGEVVMTGWIDRVCG